jgi:hypothetical protein
MVGSDQVAGIVATGVKVRVNLPVLFVKAYTSEKGAHSGVSEWY